MGYLGNLEHFYELIRGNLVNSLPLNFPSLSLAWQKLQFTLVKVKECYHFSLFFRVTTSL